MRERAKRTGTGLILRLFIALTLASPSPRALAQIIESARERYEQGDYAGAEEELREILEEDSENIAAQSLLREIELRRKREEAAALTERALIEINSRNFKEAYAFLERALLLDPENRRARELYLSIHEVLEIEGETVEEMLDRHREEMAVIEEAAEEPVTEVVAVEEAPVTERPEEEPPEIVMEEPSPPPEEEIERLYDQAFIRGGLVFTFANSNNLDYIDSKVVLLGIRFDSRYYFDFLKRSLGVSFDYTGDYLKLGGDDNINFGTHRMNFSVRYRFSLFERDYGKLTLGARMNYHVFLLNNREDQGVYNFTRVYGPSLGVFVEDPVIYRFWKAEFSLLLDSKATSTTSSSLARGRVHPLRRNGL